MVTRKEKKKRIGYEYLQVFLSGDMYHLFLQVYFTLNSWKENILEGLIRK